MATILLVTRPKHDITMRYISTWAEKVIAEAKTRGHTVLDLSGSRARRENVEGMIAKQQPHVFFFNGHGNAHCVGGHDDEILIAADDNDAILAGSLVYALSCKSARVLGVRSVGKGTRAYIGYGVTHERWRYFLSSLSTVDKVPFSRDPNLRSIRRLSTPPS